jgi:hypothetical protein
MADDETRVMKLAGTAAALAAAALTQRVIAAGWKAVKGHRPPAQEDHESGIGLGEVLAAAAVTGAVVAVVRILAARGASSAVRALTATKG